VDILLVVVVVGIATVVVVPGILAVVSVTVVCAAVVCVAVVAVSVAVVVVVVVSRGVVVVVNRGVVALVPGVPVCIDIDIVVSIVVLLLVPPSGVVVVSGAGPQSILGYSNLPLLILMLDFFNLSNISSGLAASPDSINKAAQPETCAVAVLVPLPLERPLLSEEDMIFMPGAKRSVFALLFVKAQGLSSFLSPTDAPTDTTSFRQAG